MFLVQLALLTTSCGIDPADLIPRGQLVPPENQFPTVVLATKKQVENNEVDEHRYIVAFRVDPGANGHSFKSFQAEHRFHFSLLADSFLSDPGIKDIHFITTVDMSNPGDEATAADIAPPASMQLMWDGGSSEPLEGAISMVEFSDHESAARVLKQWEEHGDIWFAEPDHLSFPETVLQKPFTTDLAAEYKNAGVWYLNDIKLPQALETLASKQLEDVQTPVVAVLDSGLDWEHPALTENVWRNPVPGQSGCAGDEIGCDTTVFIRGKIGIGSPWPYLTSGPGQPCPEGEDGGICQHGTHVAGLVAAKIGNAAGGSCPVCLVMPIKIIKNINGKGAASDSAILQGFKYLNLFKAKTNIVRVANSSFGKLVRSRAVALLISALKKSPNEVLVVGAAGNEDTMIRSYPAAFNDAIAVASLQQGFGKSNFSNFGPWVDIAAPGGVGQSTGGGNINSTIPGGGYIEKPGTSMASPIVAGVAGLMLAYQPGRSWKDLRKSLVDMADPSIYNPDVFNGNNYNYYYPRLAGESVRRPLLGSGIVDANAALDGVKATGFFGGRLARVQRGCSAVDVRGFATGIPLMVLFLVPMLAVLPGVLKSRIRGRS